MSGPDEESAAPPSLLRLLPLAIRHNIYRFLGLASWTDHPLAFDLTGIPAHHRGFQGLLLSCRAIYAEAAGLLYSANLFLIQYSGPGSLQPLHALTPQALSHLADLRIVLSQAACHSWCMEGDSDARPLLHPRANVYGSSSEPNGSDLSPSAQASRLLGEWQTAANYLSSAIATSTRLELGLVCDIHPEHPKAIDLAHSFVEPLSRFPALRDCHIRLCHKPDSQLKQVAEHAVLQACGMPARSASETFNFLTLPCELRLRILEFTDLVTPSKEVWWCRTYSAYHWWSVGGDRPCGHLSCSFDECWYRGLDRDEPSTSCFCRRHHASWTTSCTCWAPPGSSLFLVCRAWCRDAQAVFCSTNRFVVHDFQIDPPWILKRHLNRRHQQDEDDESYPYNRLAVSHFLREVIPVHCIASLRFVELVFPPYFPQVWPHVDHPAMQDWRETVRWIQDKINGPALTIRLVGAPANLDIPIHPVITVAEGDMIQSSYLALMEPLKWLAAAGARNRLDKFYADLPNPWRATAASRNNEEGWAWMKKQDRAAKERAERFVMGERYDWLRGQKEPEQSLWKHGYSHYQ